MKSHEQLENGYKQTTRLPGLIALCVMVVLLVCTFIFYEQRAFEVQKEGVAVLHYPLCHFGPLPY